MIWLKNVGEFSLFLTKCYWGSDFATFRHVTSNNKRYYSENEAESKLLKSLVCENLFLSNRLHLFYLIPDSMAGHGRFLCFCYKVRQQNILVVNPDWIGTKFRVKKRFTSYNSDFAEGLQRGTKRQQVESYCSHLSPKKLFFWWTLSTTSETISCLGVSSENSRTIIGPVIHEIKTVRDLNQLHQHEALPKGGSRSVDKLTVITHLQVFFWV